MSVVMREGGSERGELRLEGEILSYRAGPNVAFRLRVPTIGVLGEYTTPDGPAADDYFLTFVTLDAVRHDVPFYSQHRDDVLRQLSRYWDAPINLTLASSTSDAHRIVWPLSHVDQPLFTYTTRPATTLGARALAYMGWKTLDERLSSSVFDALTHAAKPSRTILVADDDTNVLTLVSKDLRRRSFEVDTAKDGSQVLQKMKKQHYDVILLDLEMPKVTGYEVLRKLSREHPEQCVIVLSAHHLSRKKRHELRVVQGYLAKPFAMDKLYEAIDRCFPVDRTVPRAG
jgi:CheY-like chemotaxis protein